MRGLPPYVLVAVFGVFFAAGPAPAAPADRGALRAQRVAMTEEASADADARAERAVAVVTRLLDRIENGPVVAEFEPVAQLIAGLGRLDADRVGGLAGRVAKLPAEKAPDALDGDAKAAWDGELAQVHAAITDRAFGLMKKAAEANEASLAASLMWEVLWFHPDHPGIRDALGMKSPSAEVRRAAGLDPGPARDAISAETLDYERFDPDRRWYAPFNAKRLEEGFAWDPGLGWVDVSKRDRYEKGGVYDLQRKRWVLLSEANDYHRRPDRAWDIRTEHLRIRGTADLAVLADAATKLELLSREIFALYAGFFAQKRGDDVLRLSLGLTKAEPLEVWILHDKETYQDVSDAPDWSGGVYDPAENRSYFYGAAGETMYHEFTHHLLEAYTGQNRAEAWLVEGIAGYTETVTFERGQVTLPGARPSSALSLEDLLKLRTNRQWHGWHDRAERNDRPSAYADAASLVTYAMNAEDGRYRADTIDYVRDAYLGRTRRAALWDYLGLSDDAFAAGYARWRGR